MKKLANVIKVDKKLINDIAKEVIYNLDNYIDLLEEDYSRSILIAKYPFIRGSYKKYVEIYLQYYGPSKASIGSYERDENNPKIYLYASTIENDKDLWKISQFLLHEITHFIDDQYKLLNNRSISNIDEFIKDFSLMLNEDNFNYTISAPYASMEEISAILLRKISKTNKFKRLLRKHNIEYNDHVKRKLFRQILDRYELYNKQMIRNRESRKIGLINYYNSDSEMNAYTNEIVNEIIDILRESGIDYYTEPLDLLYISKTYTDIEKFLFPKNKKKILYEVGKAIIEYNSNLSTNPIWDKYTKNLNGQEHFQFRYLNKLYNENVEKFEQLAKDKEYLIKYKNLISLVIKMNFEKKKLDMVAKKMQEIAA